jgi:oligopeptide/dipeptide ABC transporter ATP-binding protein
MSAVDPVPAASGDRTLLEIRDLSLDFGSPRGRIHALRNVSLRIPEGRIVGIVGESGCGKSTLAYTIAGLLPENAQVVGGTVTFEGRDLLSLPREEMRGIRGARLSMIFQDPMTALNPVRSIEKQMVDAQHHDGSPRAVKRQRAADMLQKVGIPDPDRRLRGYPHEFSGGMRQRICIAMALLVRPALLLADEPTTALDATLEVQIIRLLKSLQKDIGCSVLFVSHHLGAVAELCDEVAVMYAGEVVEYGTVREIFRDPAHPYTRALLRCDPGRIREKTRRLPTISGEVPSLLAVPRGCVFRDRCPDAVATCRDIKPAPLARSTKHSARCHLLGEAGAWR